MAGGAQDAGGAMSRHVSLTHHGLQERQESEGLLRECQHCLAHVARQVG